MREGYTLTRIILSGLEIKKGSNNCLVDD